MTAQSIGFAGGRAGDGHKAIEKIFSPEFRNRLDEIVFFQNLAPDVMGRVVDKFVAELDEQLRERKITLELSAAARLLLAEKGYDPDFGARPLARVIQREIKDPLTEEVLFGRLSKGGTVRVIVGGDESFLFEYDDRDEAAGTLV